MATHSSILAWGIPGTEKPGELQSMGSLRVGLDGATNNFTLLLKALWLRVKASEELELFIFFF